MLTLLTDFIIIFSSNSCLDNGGDKSSNGEPCNSCIACKEIIEGRNIDVIEIDGASNRGIEEIRGLREQIKYPPMASNYKIYIM